MNNIGILGCGWLGLSLAINLKNKEIAGKEIKIEFEDSYFGNESNDPIVKGRSGHSNKDKLKVYKAVFSTCNIENKKCRGWELSADEFKHDKSKKIFEYVSKYLDNPEKIEEQVKSTQSILKNFKTKNSPSLQAAKSLNKFL